MLQGRNPESERKTPVLLPFARLHSPHPNSIRRPPFAMSGVIDHKAIRYIWLKNTSKRPAGEPIALFACVIAKFRRARETQVRHLMVTDTQLLNFGAQDYSEPNRAMLIANLTGVVRAEQSCEVLFQFKGEYGTHAFALSRRLVCLLCMSRI